LMLMPDISAWNFQGHQTVAETMYYSADFSLQKKLNLTLLKEGAIAPDKVFHDVRLHHYPPSYQLAQKWLNEADYYYKKEEYNNASYAFGVASHYISDSFVAPHYISKEPASLHSQFERIKNYNLDVKCYKSEINLNESLYAASKNEKDWSEWVLTKNESIPKREFEQALNLAFPVFLNTFNSTCNDFKTEVITQNFYINKNVIIFLIINFVVYLTFIFNRRYKIIKRIKF